MHAQKDIAARVVRPKGRALALSYFLYVDVSQPATGQGSSNIDILGFPIGTLNDVGLTMFSKVAKWYSLTHVGLVSSSQTVSSRGSLE